MQSETTKSSSAIDIVANQTSSFWTDSVSVDQYRAFGEKYFDDPGGFTEDCFLWDKGEGEGPTKYQLEIMQALIDYERVCARGPHGLGKSSTSAWTVWWFALTRDALMMDWKVVTTASAWRQLIKYLWPEIHKWGRKLNWVKIGRGELKPKEELTTLHIKLNYGEAFAVASDKSEYIEGAHADHMYYLFDESKIIPDATWDSAEGAMTGSKAYWLAVSTPGVPQGRFYEIQTKQPGLEDWWTRHVTLQEAVDAGRIDLQWANDRLKQWGEMSTEYQNRVVGNFAQEEADTLIPLHWVEAAMKRYMARIATSDLLVDQIGLDVARRGGDQSVLAKRNNAIR